MTEAMFDERLMAEIRETNLSYLILAQSLIRRDRAQALYRLGIGEEVAALIEGLSPAQLLKIAQGNRVMCKLRFDDEMMWSLLADCGVATDRASGDGSAGADPAGRAPGDRGDRSAPLLHASILMAGRYGEAIEEGSR